MADDDRNVQQQHPELREGMRMVSSDGVDLGTVREVFRDVGSIETFGAMGIPPQQEGFDAERYGYDESSPGAGDDFFTVRRQDGGNLYVPFNAIQEVSGDRVMVVADSSSVPAMGWNVRPDVLAAATDEYPEDEGGEPLVA